MSYEKLNDPIKSELPNTYQKYFFTKITEMTYTSYGKLDNPIQSEVPMLKFLLTSLISQVLTYVQIICETNLDS